MSRFSYYGGTLLKDSCRKINEYATMLGEWIDLQLSDYLKLSGIQIHLTARKLDS